MEKEDFYLKVAYALSGCQLVEQELKLYITEALGLAKKCIGNKMPFKMSGEDYADASLERLIETFKKLSDNQALVKELGKFKKERNFLSHKGIAHCLDYSEDGFLHAVFEYQDRLEAIQIDARRLRSAIRVEAGKFNMYLYFDPITKRG